MKYQFMQCEIMSKRHVIHMTAYTVHLSAILSMIDAIFSTTQYHIIVLKKVLK